MRRVNIIAWNNGGGLSRDVETLVSALPPAQFDVTLNCAPLDGSPIVKQRIVHRGRNLLRAASAFGKHIRSPFDINIFLEDISPEFFPLARINAFIPNPEWFRAYMRHFLRGIDVVFCKTSHACEVFRDLGSETRLVGFTSDDRLDPGHVGAREAAFLHVAGRSWQKGTNALIETWLQHPEWPSLTVIQNAKTYSQSSVQAVDAQNINHILERLDDRALRELQNRYAFHLCPSEVEGFGHCVVEAMSARALTLTTDAPPMNELVTRDRGVLVPYEQSAPQRRGVTYFVNRGALERAVEAIIDMDAQERARLATAARQWYENNNRQFRSRLVQAIEDFCSA